MPEHAGRLLVSGAEEPALDMTFVTAPGEAAVGTERDVLEPERRQRGGGVHAGDAGEADDDRVFINVNANVGPLVAKRLPSGRLWSRQAIVYRGRWRAPRNSRRGTRAPCPAAPSHALPSHALPWPLSSRRFGTIGDLGLKASEKAAALRTVITEPDPGAGDLRPLADVEQIGDVWIVLRSNA